MIFLPPLPPPLLTPPPPQVTSTLRFTRQGIRYEDQGRYRCVASNTHTTPASSEYTYITVRRKLMIIICHSLRLGKKWPCTQAPKVVQRYLQGYDSCRGTCVHNYFFGQSLATKQSKKRVAMVKTNVFIFHESKFRREHFHSAGCS